MRDNYSDIIDLPHFEPSVKHKRMPMESRAAQFAPFSALSGYEDAIEEASRLTESKIDIAEDTKIVLNNKLKFIKNNKIKGKIEITYFVPDSLKKGGKYVKENSCIKKIDINRRYLLMDSEVIIPFDSIISITSDELKIDGYNN